MVGRDPKVRGNNWEREVNISQLAKPAILNPGFGSSLKCVYFPGLL